MKFVTFLDPKGTECAGWIVNNGVIDMALISDHKLPNNIRELIENYDEFKPLIEKYKQTEPTYSMAKVQLLTPLPNPNSFRDFVSFETHVKNASKKMGHTVPREWYEIPIFYFSNHLVMKGPNDEIVQPKHCEKLDYELEVACVIGKKGSNIKASEAENYIFGYTILNDWSARDLQAKEMKVNLGPAKGKDFATSIGPYIVTKDELNQYKEGNKLNLTMIARVNGEIWSIGNFKDIYYGFEQMIERASENVTLYPGDVIGSGTVGFGCILELDHAKYRWLEPGDEVELEVTGLGKLKNRIVEGEEFLNE